MAAGDSRCWQLLLAHRHPLVIFTLLALDVATPVKLAVTFLNPVNSDGEEAPSAAERSAAALAGRRFIADAATSSRDTNLLKLLAIRRRLLIVDHIFLQPFL